MAAIRWTSATASEVCRRFDVDPESPLPRPGHDTPADYVADLSKAGAWSDALRLLAYGLPTREAVWWGCVCYRLAQPAPSDNEAALRVVVDWVLAPSEKLRREAESFDDTSTVPGCLALAVFYSGGSIGPPEVPVVPPSPSAAPRAVAGAVILASTLRGPDATTGLRNQFVSAGLEVAQGQHLWLGAANQ